MSAAHAESATGIKPFANVFMHAGMVSLDGEKMSKSLGNLVLESKLRALDVDPMAIRLVLLSHHYRSDWEWFDDELELAKKRLERWRLAFACPLGAPSPVVEIITKLGTDLDTPSAIEIMDTWARTTIDGDESESTETTAIAVDAILGIV
jgi:L-cysteine:1D-myo-inositol 2-amino-2-deoxy-alpha-D-glucopyranoside ligase